MDDQLNMDCSVKVNNYGKNTELIFIYPNNNDDGPGFKPKKLSVPPHSRRYKDEELLQILRDLYEKLGRTPLASEVPQRVTIRIRFGSWENALRKAGIPINKPKKTKYENDELLEILQEKMLKNMDALQDTKRFNNQH